MKTYSEKEDIKKQAFAFLKGIHFEGKELTFQTIEFINQQVKENQLDGFFSLEIWSNKREVYFDVLENIALFQFIIENHINQLNTRTKHELYNLLLSMKVANQEYNEGLRLAAFIERNFNKNTINHAFTLGRKGEIFRKLSRFGEALVCFNNSLEMLSSLEKSKLIDINIFNTKNGIALAYFGQNELDKAIEIFEKNLKEQIKEGFLRGVSRCYINLGFLYKETGKYNLALDYYFKAQKLDFSEGFIDKAEKQNITIAKIYLLNENLELAKKYIAICKKSEQEYIKKEAVLLELKFELKKHELAKETDLKKLKKLTKKSVQIVEKTELVKAKLDEFPFIAKAYEYLENYTEAIKIINKRQEIFEAHVEQEKAFSYKQLKESHEIQLQQKEINQKEKANQKLQIINNDLEQFTYMASHDLKSPLRNITAFCSLIEDEDTSKEEIKAYTNLIKTDAKKMTNLISSLLDYSKIGFSEVEMVEVDLTHLVKRVVKGLEQNIKEKKARITLNDLPNIKGNSVLIEQLFENLISNALKYNDKEVPRIEIIGKQAKEGFVISIKDNGVGIPKEKTEEIFKTFTRAHSASKFEGSGVGLATCKKIMDIHSGTISVSSEVGKGSCFTLKF